MPLPHNPGMPGRAPNTACKDAALQMCYRPGYVDDRSANRLFDQLRTELDWRSESIVMFGRRQPVPRQVWWCGDSGLDYRYAGVGHSCDGWHPRLDRLRAQLSEHLAAAFNFVLLNRYRCGDDHMGWHSDDEPGLGPQPVIASISLGATRRFRVRARLPPDPGASVDLEHGSLLVAWGDSQRRYQHCITRTRRPVGERINLTFRTVVN